MTISPQDLTAEERAIVDSFALEFSKTRMNETASTSYSAGWSLAFQFILARRALFTPESEKPAQAKDDDESKRCSFCAEPASIERGGKSFCLDHLPDDLRRKPAPVAAGEMPEAVTVAIAELRAEAEER